MLNLQRITWIAFAVWLVTGLTVCFAYSRYSRRNSLLARCSR
jgi:basic amino acid/polyamine antiporter, APA family